MLMYVCACASAERASLRRSLSRSLSLARFLSLALSLFDFFVTGSALVRDWQALLLVYRA